MTDERPPIVDKLRDAVQRQERQRRQVKPFSIAELKATGQVVGLCIVMACLYGMVHAQLGLRVSEEYFTLSPLLLFHIQPSALLALWWGVFATWWVGVVLGAPLAFICRYGPRPKLDAAKLIRPILVLLLVMGVASIVAGVMGYHLGRVPKIILQRLPADRRAAYAANRWAHCTAFIVGLFGGFVLWFHAWRRRRALAEPRPEVRLPLSETSRN
ncbi:MAG: hypothetical protein GXP25_13340 [Planctomycetes bacterium]|nr:hypothetical protein [Planctomycetota bacterium]